jgi:hypothetical protein
MGTDKDGNYLKSERNVFSNYQQYMIPQSFYNTLTQWGDGF